MEIIAQSHIKRVVVHARGALVTRAVAELDSGGDDVDLILKGITPLAQPGSLRAVIAAPRSVESIRAALEIGAAAVEPGPSVEKVELLDAELSRLYRERSLLEARATVLAAATANPGLAARAKQELVRERIHEALETVRSFDALADETDARLLALEETIQRLSLERQAAALADAQTSASDRLGQQHPRRTIVARLGGRGPIRGLEITYAVDAARWWPLYTLRLGEGEARWWIEALVAQESGEDWSNVELALSTGEMIFDARLPELPSLRLGKARPKARASYRAAPGGLEAMFAGYDRGFAHLSVRTETTVTLGYIADTTRPEPAPEPPPPPLPMLAAPSAIADGFGGMARDMVAPQSMPRKGGFFASSPSMGAPARRGAPAPGAGGGAPEMKKRAQLEKEAKTDEVDLASYEEGGAPPADDPHSGSIEPTEEWLDFNQLRLGFAIEHRTRGRLHIAREQLGSWVSDRVRQVEHVDPGAPVRDPRQSRGNFDHRYEAKGRSEIPSDGVPHRLRIQDAEAKPRFFLTTVPREAAEVHREAELLNPFDAPLLEGPVDVYSDGSFLTTAAIENIDRGGSFRVGLGVEERIRVARNARVEEQNTGLLGGYTEVDHEITIDLSSSIAEPLTVEVRDRVPVSDDKALEVKLLREEPKGSAYHQLERDPLRGGHHWSVRIAPGGQTRISYAYRLTFPSKNEIVGGNRREQ